MLASGKDITFDNCLRYFRSEKQKKTSFFFCFSLTYLYLCISNMNWRFILQWVVTFTVCLVVYDLTGSFWMSLGILILLVVVKSIVMDWIEKRKEGKA